ncbi:MAG: hypothetical protein EA363_08625 [Balneolaceae bacterium]|nr:MAG: hypothetical protein EA363_08625 [Balneolaceae bacterium]
MVQSESGTGLEPAWNRMESRWLQCRPEGFSTELLFRNDNFGMIKPDLQFRTDNFGLIIPE